MSLVISTGANLGDRFANLETAKQVLCEKFSLIAASRVYSSPAVDYEDQPPFLNQVLEFRIPQMEPLQAMQELLNIEKAMGRERIVPKGPRTIDLDIIFWGELKMKSDELKLPHPRWSERAFIVLPLRELPFFQTLQKSYKIPDEFNHQAVIASEQKGF